MKRIKGLNWYQKGILILVTAMALIFTVIYAVAASREGIFYRGQFLTLRQENGSAVYSGKIQGEPVSFAVSGDGTVLFQYGEEISERYTVREDPAAVPENGGEEMTGIEFYRGEELLFRGGVMRLGRNLMLYNADGSQESREFYIDASSGMTIDARGNIKSPGEPAISEILEVMSGTELTHRGDWGTWLTGMATCALTAFAMLFANEMFYWGLRFQIRNPDLAEPSDWEIAGRYIAWTALAAMALMIFIMGLQ